MQDSGYFVAVKTKGSPAGVRNTFSKPLKAERDKTCQNDELTFSEK